MAYKLKWKGVNCLAKNKKRREENRHKPWKIKTEMLWISLQLKCIWNQNSIFTPTQICFLFLFYMQQPEKMFLLSA